MKNHKKAHKKYKEAQQKLQDMMRDVMRQYYKGCLLINQEMGREHKRQNND